MIALEQLAFETLLGCGLFFAFAHQLKEWLCPPSQPESIALQRLSQIEAQQEAAQDADPEAAAFWDDTFRRLEEINDTKLRLAAAYKAATPKFEILAGENGKPAVRPHTILPLPVSTLRLTFQDGSEMDVSSDLEFAGMSEANFRVAYEAFESTRAELLGAAKAPHLNSKAQQDLDRG